MAISAELIGAGTLPAAPESCIASSSIGVVYSGNNLFYQTADTISPLTFVAGSVAGYVFGFQNGATEGFLGFDPLAGNGDIIVSDDLVSSSVVYADAGAIGDHFFSVKGSVTVIDVVIMFDAATGFIYVSNDGGVSFDAGNECDIDFVALLGENLNVTADRIFYDTATGYYYFNSPSVTYRSLDLITWEIPATTPGAGMFCVSDVVWSFDYAAESVEIIYDWLGSSPTAGALSLPGSITIKVVRDPENDAVLLYAFSDDTNFNLYRLTGSGTSTSPTSGNQGITGGGINGQGGAVGFSGVSASNSSGISLASLAYPAGIVPRGVNDFGIDLGL